MTSGTSKATAINDLAKGVRWGLTMATIFAAFGAIGWAIRGSKSFGDGPEFPKFLLAEFATGIVGGAIVGLVHRNINSVVSAAAVGLLVGLVWGIAIELAELGAMSWRSWDMWVVLAFGALGLVVGGMSWRRWRKMHPTPSP
jgi:uncharacterized membrane protein (UPF0136 family)